MNEITRRLTGFIEFVWELFLMIGFILGAIALMALVVVVLITFAPVIILILIFTGG